MDQYAVYANPSAPARREAPYVVVIQSEGSMGRESVVVAPLTRRSDAEADDRLVVPVRIAGEAFVVLFPGLAAIPRRSLDKPIAHLPELRDRIAAAIDFLFLGF